MIEKGVAKMPNKKTENKKAVNDEFEKNKKSWRKRIVTACNKAGTYKPTYDLLIEELSRLMAIRESASKSFKESGNQAIIEQVNISGNKYQKKNPSLSLMLELEPRIFSYLRELGLTPKGSKSLGASDVLQGKENGKLQELIDWLDEQGC